MSLTIMPSPRIRSPFAVVWTRDDCATLEADGYLNYRYELIEGDIIRKMPQNIPHRTAVMLTISWLLPIFGSNFVQTQATIDVSPEDNPTSEPEPDVAVLTESLSDIQARGQRNPTAAQVRLVVEVSDTTLEFDLITKAGLYARAGIAEYWVVDLNGRMLHIHRNPTAGQYQDITQHGEQETVACLATPHSPVAVATLLP